MKKGKIASRQSKDEKEDALKTERTAFRQSKDEKREGLKREKPASGKEGGSGPDQDALERLKGIKVLVPLLSKREAHPVFIERVAGKAREIILLLVIDTKAMTGQFGFATNEIATGNHLMEQVKEALGKKRKSCSDVIEWGETATKIEHLAELHRVDKVYVVKQDNHFFKKLLQDMKEKLAGVEIEVVQLPEA